VDRYVDVLGK